MDSALLPRSRWRHFLTALPGIGTALLPKLACPSCWPAYAGLLSLLGIEFMNYTPYLFPLTILFLSLPVVSLGYRAEKRRGYRPFAIGILAAIIVVVGKFVLLSGWAAYGGIALLMAASLWNAWPRRGGSGTCSACIPKGAFPKEGDPSSETRINL